MTSSTKVRSYSELSRLETFEDRFDYLVLNGAVGEETYGYDRWINQRFYKSREWQRTRDLVIARDEGLDLGIPGYDIRYGILIHHMNPLQLSDIIHGSDSALNPENLITTTKRTHNAIHYGNRSLLPKPFTSRSRNDTRLW